MTRHTGTLVPFPAWESNPYLNMVTLAAEAAGWKITGNKTLDGLLKRTADLVPGDAVHVHWTLPVTAGVSTAEEAAQRRQLFREILLGMRARGVTLLWTVHNEIAHDTPFPETERKVAQDLAELAHVIFQLHEYTSGFVADSFRLPAEKLVTLPHSSYLGIYPDQRDAALARELLGVPQEAPTVGFVGQLRPYKGLDALFRAADLAAEQIPDLTVLVAGKLLPADAPAFSAALPRRAATVLATRFIPDEDLWKWFRASDVAAFPYQKILNSGSILLASTFDCPSIIPDNTPLAHVYADEPWVRSYRTGPEADRALAEAIMGALPADPQAVAAARSYAQRNAPYAMARTYAAVLNEAAATESEGSR